MAHPTPSSAMRWRRAVTVGLTAVFLSAASACLYPPRDGILANLPCTEQGDCAAGFVCHLDICVLDGSLQLDAGVVDADAGVDAGPVDGGPDDGGVDVRPPPLRLEGAATGAQRMQSTSFRADVRVGGGSAVSGRTGSASYQMTWGAK